MAPHSQDIGAVYQKIVEKNKNMIYGFDIDGTICSTDCDYSEAKPIGK